MIIESRAPVRVDFAGGWTDVKYFANPFGGATTNAAINHYVTGRATVGAHSGGEEGISVNYETGIPAGSGLGTSSALNVVWLSLASGKPIESEEQRGYIAEQAYQVETVLGIIGGKQDHYAAAYGGFHLFLFEESGVKAVPIAIAPERIRELESLITLCYTGQARLSSNLHETVWGGFRTGKREIVDSLFIQRESAYKARDILESGNFDEIGPLLNLQHQMAQQLDSSLTNEHVEGIFDLARPTTRGGKCCGAGGGGCMMMISDSPDKRERTAQVLRDNGIRVIDFQFTSEGLSVSRQP